VLWIAALGELAAGGDHERRRQGSGIGTVRTAAVVVVDALQPVDQGEGIVLGVGAPAAERIGHRREASRKLGRPNRAAFGK